MSGTDYVLTPNLGLYKPLPNADVNAWGTHLNLNADTLDSTVYSLQTAFLPLAGGTMTGALNYTATDGSASRSAQDRAAEVINVKDFGAKGDGVTDDTAAINAALNYIRAHLVAAYHTPFCVVFPYGRYVVTAPLNFTSLAAINGGVIDGQGSEIWAKHTGVVIDCLGARWLKFRDLTVFGDPTTIPRIGIQIGRITAFSADYHSFYNVQVWGSFSFTALYNYGSETCGYYTSSFRNDQTGANKFCMVIDGLNHWNASSTFVTVTNAVETPVSCGGGLYSICTWQGAGNNGVVWMGSVIQQLFHACYASCTAGSIFTIYQYNGGSPAATGLYIDVHCETTGLQYSFLMTGAATKTFGYVLDLSFQDLSNEAASSIFAIDPGSSLTSFELRHVRLNVFPTGPGTTASLFDVPSKWSVRAEFAALYAGLGAPLPALWTGPVMNLNAPASSFETLYKWASTARPTSVPSGTIGYATDTNRFEVYDGTSWFNHLRTSGDTMTGQLNVGTGTASAAIALVGPTASQRRIDFYTAASLRWRFTANNTAESSTAAGSDLNLQSFDNTGASIGFPLIVERATGITTLTSLKVSGNSGFNNTAPIAKPTVSGAKGSNAALASLLTALVAYGLVTDSTSA